MAFRNNNMVYYETYYKGGINMNNRELLVKQIEREQKFCDAQEVDSEAYDRSFDRLIKLRKEFADLDKVEADNVRKEREMADCKKDRFAKNTIEVVKIVGTGIIMPCIGFVVVTAFEKDDSFTSSLKRVVEAFVPKKLN